MDTNKPVKKIKASAIKYNSKIPSNKVPGDSLTKNRKTITIESPIEKVYTHFLDFDNSVKSYEPYPKTFYPYGDSDKRFYTPDFRVIYHSGFKIYVEIKKEISSLKNDYLEKIELSKALMKNEGYDFKFVEKDELKKEPYLSNIRFFRRYLDNSFAIKACVSDLMFPNDGVTTLEELMAINPKASIRDFYSLIAMNALSFDMWNQSFDKETVLTYSF